MSWRAVGNSLPAVWSLPKATDHETKLVSREGRSEGHGSKPGCISYFLRSPFPCTCSFPALLGRKGPALSSPALELSRVGGLQRAQPEPQSRCDGAGCLPEREALGLSP